MDIKECIAKFSQNHQAGETSGAYAVRIGKAMVAEVDSDEDLKTKVTVLAVLAALAPIKVDVLSGITPRPKDYVVRFLSAQTEETKALFESVMLKVDSKLTDKANYYLSRRP